MEKEHHDFFCDGVRQFNILAGGFKAMAEGLDGMKNKIIRYDNEVASLERRVKEKEAALESIEKQIKERQAIGEQSVANLREALNKKDLALREREAKIRFREEQIQVAQKKADEILSAAESKQKRSKQAVEA